MQLDVSVIWSYGDIIDPKFNDVQLYFMVVIINYKLILCAFDDVICSHIIVDKDKEGRFFVHCKICGAMTTHWDKHFVEENQI